MRGPGTYLEEQGVLHAGPEGLGDGLGLGAGQAEVAHQLVQSRRVVGGAEPRPQALELPGLQEGGVVLDHIDDAVLVRYVPEPLGLTMYHKGK